jgi:hypothetical protein
MGTADVAPCHIQAADGGTELSSTDMTCHRRYNCTLQLMTDLGLQCTEIFEVHHVMNATNQQFQTVYLLPYVDHILYHKFGALV